jgi:protein SCO1/2
MRTLPRFRLGTLTLVIAGVVGMHAPRAIAHDEMNQSAMDHAAMGHGAMDHATKVMRSTVDYKLPAVKLVREDGQTVSMPAELNDGRPVFLTFIYTTCTTICPIASQTFAQLQDALGSEHAKVHMVSISIDPEQDTPPRLREYAKRFGAGPDWQHYTGTVEASIATQRAFDVYRGDKMNHNPVVLMRAAPGQPWLRVDGFATAKELLQDYRHLVAS